MKACGAFLDDCLLELRIDPSDFPVPLRNLARGRLAEFENAALQRTGAAQREFTLQCVSGQRIYWLPFEIFSVEALHLNGYDITDYRLPASEIISGD